MITVIARKEALEIVRDGRFRWAAVSVLLLLLVALLSGVAHYDRVLQQRADASATVRTVWTTQQDKNPHVAGCTSGGIWAFKPITPLAMLDYGVTTYTGTALLMRAHRIQHATYRPVDDATGVARLGELTAAVVLQWLIPLLIVFLAFDTFAGERQRGTLRQLMSLGVAPGALTLGKALGLAAPLGAVLVPASVVGAAALLLGPSAEWSAWSLPRLGALTLVYLAYFALFIGFSLVVSMLARTPRTALLLLLAFWFGNAFVAPRLANDVADAVRPGLDPVAFAMKKQTISKAAHGKFQERGEAITERLMKESGVETPEELSVNVPGLNFMEAEAADAPALRALYDELGDAFEAQNRIVQAGALLAPLLAVQSLSMALAGTDYAHHRHFARSAEDYRFNFVQILNRDLRDNARPGDQWDSEYTAGSDLWESIPAFAYAPPGFGWAIRYQVTALVMLAIWLVGLLVFTRWAVRNMDPNA
uniref:ABC-2 type transport system permease protein n=1 Tax=Candidatus Kentrum sp. FW TaxID=2126338 RepID=A0A450TYX3_9GAMM|nr:MAG: ABC-2 type transport system permease protein [Candidatus Kentron sp. FW]